jgi:hypothetical protein
MEAFRRLSLNSVRAIEAMAVVGALAYMLVVGWAMFATTYDVWGAFVTLPIIVAVSGFALLKLFPEPEMFKIAMFGLIAKLIGTFLRYWVVFGAYGGAGDSKSYHDVGTSIAQSVARGDQSLFTVIPHQVGTRFIESLTGTIYTIMGSSQLAGFVIFSWIGYWGLVLFVKAAPMGFADIDLRRYALLTFLAPTLVFWPSSIGKEAWMMFSLGLMTWGVARGLGVSWGGRTISAIAAGTVAASFVRPHQAAVWLAALVLALLVAAGRSAPTRPGRDDVARRATARAWAVMMGVLGVVALVVVGRVTVSYLAGSGDEGGITEQIGDLFDENSRRSTGGGSSFTPPPIASPLQWPSAIFQTLFRPFILRARDIAQLIPAVETNLLLTIFAVSFRRAKRLPRTVLTRPYVAFCLFAAIGFGLAFSTFGNLAILVRQRSLVYPLIFVLFCLPKPLEHVRPTLPVDTTWRRPAADFDHAR